MSRHFLLFSLAVFVVRADLTSSGKGVLLVENDKAEATTQREPATTAAVIVESAKAKGLPKWYLPGIVQAIKEVYPSLDKTNQDKIRSYVNNQSVSVNSLIDQLGNMIDKKLSSQKDELMELMKHAEYERQEAAVALYDTKMTTKEQKLFTGLIENFVDSSKSLPLQCSDAQELSSSFNSEELGRLGIPESIATLDCKNLADTLLSN